MGRKQIATVGQAELFAVETAEELAETEVQAMELETEVEPTAADMDSLTATQLDSILTGYSADEWLDIMLSTDTHTVGMSRGVAVERLFMTKQALKRERSEAAMDARTIRAIRNSEANALFESARQTNVYRAMTALESRLGRTHSVIMTLARRTVTVESIQWIKGQGQVREFVASFTFAKDAYSFTLTAGKSAKFTEDGAAAMLAELLPERARDLMPAKFRDVMRTHRHKNGTPTDATGNRATRNAGPADELSAADLELYPALALVQGPRLTVGGHENMQGVALTADERRKRDRDRLKVWRERKRQEKLAAQA